jgi:hypothetical protein
MLRSEIQHPIQDGIEIVEEQAIRVIYLIGRFFHPQSHSVHDFVKEFFFICKESIDCSFPTFAIFAI